jgi:hypothetical protein
MNGWTAGEERWRAMHRGESVYDPRPEDEGPDEREEPMEEPVPEEPEVEQTESDAPNVQVNAPVRAADRVPTFQFTGAQWDAFLARACTPQHETQTEPRAGSAA